MSPVVERTLSEQADRASERAAKWHLRALEAEQEVCTRLFEIELLRGLLHREGISTKNVDEALAERARR